MDIKKRIQELLRYLEHLYEQVENYLDDSEKNKYLSKIREHQNYILGINKKINNSNLSIEELVSIHSEILNKYFS